MSLYRAFMTKTGIEFPHGIGFVRIAKQSIITPPKRFYEVPYHEQYESRDNESQNWNAKCVNEQYSSFDDEKSKNLEEFITKFKSTKIHTNKAK